MAKIIEINGYDLIGKTTHANSLVKGHLELAIRISDLPQWGSYTPEERVQIYDSLNPEKYALFFSDLHAEKNRLILRKGTDQVIDRGFLTVISDFGARFLINGVTLELAKKRALEITQAKGFRQIGDQVVNLDLEGSVEHVMTILEGRRMNREGKPFTQFERAYLPRMIHFYRSVK